jgi:squalene-associated FAD-dependent desaturase
VRNVVVVGGGLAGIAAALECADAGAAVTLLEARPRLGGATFSVEKEGLWLDNGQHVFLRCCTEYVKLLHRLGVEDDVVLQPRLEIPVLAPGGRMAWLRRNGLPAPLHLGPSLVRFAHLSVRDRLRLGPAVLALRRLRLDDPALDEQSFEAWLGRHGQSAAAIRGLWDLITLPTVNLPAREASLALATKVFQTGLLERADASDIGYARVPLQQLHGDPAVRALEAAGARVHVKARVSALVPAGTGLTVSWSGGDAGQGASLDADAVVLAVPHEDAVELLPGGSLAEGVDPARLGASPIVNLHVVYDRAVTDRELVAGIESPVQFVFDRTRSTGLERGQCLAVSLSGADAYIGKPVDELRAEFVPALAELFPGAREAEVVSFFVTREPRATFRGTPGTAAHRPGPVTKVPGLYLAGAWTDTGWPATMEGAVRSGVAAARAAAGATPAARELEAA